MENLLYKVEESLLNKTLSNGLTAYTQGNCSVTLTNDGYRIYRPPNLTVADNGRTMWGGLKIQPYDQNNKDVLFKGHTYIIKWYVKGKTSNAATTVGWDNQMEEDYLLVHQMFHIVIHLPISKVKWNVFTNLP